MKKFMVATMMAGSLSLGACAQTYAERETLEGAGVGAVGGGALGAAAGAVIPGVNVLEGAAIGAAVGGIAGAIYADRNNDGRVDGYYQNGTYYEGAPPPPPPAGYYAPPPPPPPPVMRAGERG